ncbi:prevent-host-death protein [Rhodococcus sp. WB1]|uniref:type II toxin-antitoxin system Phd/YefM family antitoxin n=1 Tax=Rhodococcus TaxID=1827 RepID=UPI000622C9D1|nr:MULTISPECIES: type II toxin-antitoxin system prevent-host-death family antitoxin [Rhodococcus]AKE92855.1 prevent-host-death protein [Rhodococcus aetherivorans]ANZ28436.1 prevent-host-death protein [Rhodococcus sp. WB1]
MDRVEVAAVTRNGHRAAVLLGADDYDALRETIAVLAEKSLLADHLTGRAEIEAGGSLDAAALAEIMSAGKPDDE